MYANVMVNVMVNIIQCDGPMANSKLLSAGSGPLPAALGAWSLVSGNVGTGGAGGKRLGTSMGGAQWWLVGWMVGSLMTNCLV